MSAPKTDEHGRQLVAEGVSVIDVGDGPAVFLMHGIGGNARSCVALAKRLRARGRRTIAWDAPGYGESADRRGAVAHPALVVQILDELGLKQVDLFGTSWGGVIATVVAATRPDRVRTLVLADSTRGSGINPDKAAAMRARPSQLANLRAVAFAAARAPRLLAPGADPAVAAAVQEQMARVRVPGYRAAAEFMAGADTTDLLGRVTVPTLVLVGEHDVVTGVDESRLLAERISGARLVIIPDAGHAALSERPDTMAEAIVEFWGTR